MHRIMAMRFLGKPSAAMEGSMKYSAEDILHQSFEKKFRGYDPDQVHEFLQGMAREWDYMSSEIIRLQDEVDGQVRELREFRKRERSLLDALNTAKEVADEISNKAQERSERILEEATHRAEQIVASAHREHDAMIDELQALKHQRVKLASDLREVLDAHQRILDDVHTSTPSFDATPQEASSNTGPTIHRRPRTQPPAPPMEAADYDEDYDEDEDDFDEVHAAYEIDEGSRPTVVMDRASSSTLTGLVPQEHAS